MPTTVRQDLNRDHWSEDKNAISRSDRQIRMILSVIKKNGNSFANKKSASKRNEYSIIEFESNS